MLIIASFSNFAESRGLEPHSNVIRNLVFKTSRHSTVAALLSNFAENKGIEPSFRPTSKTRLAGERNKPIFAYPPSSWRSGNQTHITPVKSRVLYSIKLHVTVFSFQNVNELYYTYAENLHKKRRLVQASLIYFDVTTYYICTTIFSI